MQGACGGCHSWIVLERPVPGLSELLLPSMSPHYPPDSKRSREGSVLLPHLWPTLVHLSGIKLH